VNAESYSGINTFQRCPKQYTYKQIDKIQRKVRSLALFNGINAHEFLKVYFLALQAKENSDGAMAAVYNAAAKAHDKQQKVLFDDELAVAADEIDLILTLVTRFIDQYTQDWTILHVEEEFLIILDSGRVVTFTPDLVIRDRNDAVWVVDHKTTSRSVETGLPFGDMQALLYYAGVKSLYPETAGFLFSRMRKKLPTMPRLTKTGKTRVADLKRIDTTYEILRDFLSVKAPGLLSDPDHQYRLAQLRDMGDRFFWTEQVYVNDATVDAVLTDADHVLQMMDFCHDAGWYPRHLLESNGYKDCRKCEFQPLCQAELLGWDTEALLLEEYEPRDPKNPYEGEDDGEN
jgi:hypothetical protein